MIPTNSTNLYSTASIIVAPTIKEGAAFTSIQSAIDYAVANGLSDIAVKPGTYTENITIYDGIKLWSMQTPMFWGDTIINGKITTDTSGNLNASICGFVLQANLDYIIDVGAVNSVNLYVTDCLIGDTTNDLISVNNSNAALYFRNCTGSFSTNNKFIDIVSGNTIQFDFCDFNAPGAYTSISTIVGATFVARYSVCTFGLSLSGGATFDVQHSRFPLGGSNVTCIAITGALTNSYIKFSDFESGTASALSINDTSVVLGRSKFTVISSNANAIDGTGSLVVSDIDFAGSSNTIAGTVTTSFIRSQLMGRLKLITPLEVSYGGTGDASLTAYAVLCGGTTATGAVQSVASVGTSGQVLTSNGAGFLPTFQNAGASQTITGDDNVALSPTSGNWNIKGESGSKTSGSGDTLKVKSPPYADGTASTLAVNSGTFATASGSYVLPAAPENGCLVEVICITTGIVVTANAGQSIQIGSDVTSVAGTATNSSKGDKLSMRYRSTDAIWYSEWVGVWVTA